MVYRDPNEHKCSPRTTTFEQVKPATSRAQPTIPGVVLVVKVVVDVHIVHGLVMELDRIVLWP